MSEVQTANWSETAASNNTATPDGWPEGQSYGSVNNCARELMAAVKRDWNRNHTTVTSAGTADAQTLTYTTAPASLVAGMEFAFIAGSTLTNTGSMTLNVGTGGALTVYKIDGTTALAAGDVTAGEMHRVVYSTVSTNHYRLVSPFRLAASGVATASIADGAVTLAKLAADAKRQCIAIACSDETTALTTGTGKVTFRMPYAFTVTSVKASLTTAQTSGNIFTVDINEGGTSILSTKITIDNNEETTATAATAAVVSDSALAADAEITIDIDQIGNGTAKGLKVYIIGYNAT